MTGLARSARGLLVAVAALVLTGGAVLAAHSLPSQATTGTQHASTVSGQNVPAVEHGTPDAEDTPEPAETPDAEDHGDATANPDRPQNHGWTVSQAAQGDTPAGFDNHGAYVSSIAKGDVGKGAAGTTGATNSAAGKAKGAAAKAAHQH